MQKEYWQERWKANQIGFNQSQPNSLLQAYIGQVCEARARIFVPLCGKSIDMLWLMEQGHEVIGVELSLIACEAFFKEQGLAVKVVENQDFTVFQGEKITLYCGDFFQINRQLLGVIDCVYDRAALIALPKTLRRHYVAHLSSLLSPHTSILLITTSYNQRQMQGPPFSIDEEAVMDLFKSRYTVRTLYNKAMQTIPQHLQTKGLVQANEHVFYLDSKKNLDAVTL